MSRLRPAFALLVVLVLAGGCALTGLTDGRTPVPSGPPAASPSASAVVTPAVPATPAPGSPGPSATARRALAVRLLQAGGRAAPDAPDADVARLVRGSTDFALDLLARVIRDTDEPNVVLGPSSITAAFALLHAGARGETATEMEEALGLDLPPFRLNAAWNALDQALRSRENRKLTLDIVNQLFGQDGYPFEPDYLRTASRQYGAPLATVDYLRRPAAVTKLINRWVSERTNGRITDIIPPDQLTAATRLVLVNATYLRAEWASRFERALTAHRTFTRLDGTTVKVPMMSQSATFPAAFEDEYTAVELPYVGGDLAMLIVMPDRPAAFLADLDADRLAAIVAGLRTRFRVEGVAFDYVDVVMPRFSARTTVALRPVLTRMGMRSVWLPATADLTGIADPTMTGEGPLNASAATHQAWVRVTEKGTEAAAATSIDAGTGGGPPVPPPLVLVDRPFLWFIRDRDTGAILFAGRITDPSVTAD